MDVFRMYLPEHRRRCLLATVVLVVAVAVVDSATKPYMSLGFLYLFPILIAGGFLARWQTITVAVVCALLSEAFSDLARAEAIPRLITVMAALTGGGLFVRELVRNRQLVLNHIQALEKQAGLRRDAEEQLEVLIDTSPAAIVTADGNGTILLANEAANRLFAPDSNPIPGDPIAFYLPDLQPLSRGNTPHFYRTSMQSKANRRNGESFSAEVWFSTFETISGPKLAAIVVDLSEDALPDHSGLSLEELLETTSGMLESVAQEVRSRGGLSARFSEPVLANGKNGSAGVDALRKKPTERESRVLRFVFEGLTNKEIAGHLGVSESSVKASLQQLFSKAGVRTRSQLVRVALEHYGGEL